MMQPVMHSTERTPGKIRHLAQCSNPTGQFSILAIDHRDNLLSSLNAHAPAPFTPAQFGAFKQQVIRHLSGESTAVLLDPDFGFAPGLAAGTLSGQRGLLFPLEVTDYSQHPSRRATNLIEGWAVGKIKRVGGAGVKLLLYYHPGAENAQHQRDLVARVVEECTRYDIPFFLEPIAYSPDPTRGLANDELRAVVVESAHTFSSMGVDVLKVEFPVNIKDEPDESVWWAALAELNAACRVPWALLSAGETYAAFKRQTELACLAGASGVMVGRAVWAEAVSLQGAAREEFLATNARQRMAELTALCMQHGTTWQARLTVADLADGWYQDYDGLD